MKYRGLKMCQKSLEKLIINTKFKKIKKFNLVVKKNNIPAIKCYENLGFTIISQNKNCNFMELKK
jgi:ribosomal protein S18 acetylase RimI-like enzyme